MTKSRGSWSGRLSQRLRARRGKDDERGASLVEYALLLALIAVVAIGALHFLGNTVAGTLNNVANDVALGGNSGGGGGGGGGSTTTTQPPTFALSDDGGCTTCQYATTVGTKTTVTLTTNGAGTVTYTASATFGGGNTAACANSTNMGPTFLCGWYLNAGTGVLYIDPALLSSAFVITVVAHETNPTATATQVFNVT